jgi:Fe/S biogenesis protein NfuA
MLPTRGYPVGMEHVLELTPEAIEKVLLVREREQDPERHALWIEVGGGGFPGTLTYDLWLAPPVGVPEGALVEDHGPFMVVIPAGGADLLRGAVLDREGDLATGGLVIREPQQSPHIDLPEGGQLPAGLAERVAWVLDTHINPAIAGHGGRAELVAVEGGAVHLRMLGGCHGCGMAAVTLREGIERTLRAVAPEITQVVDVTDHATGINPYYEPATG